MKRLSVCTLLMGGCLVLLSFRSFSKELKNTDYHYVLKKGNTPQNIAKIFGLSLSDIWRLNPSFKKHWLYGKTLHLTLPPHSIAKYTIQKGDSLYSIASHFHIPASYLQKTMDLKVQKSMWIGTSIDIPLRGDSITNHSKKTIPNSSQKKISYLIQKGDTYYSLSRKMHVDVQELQALNQHKPLLAGNALNIPQRANQQPSPPQKTHPSTVLPTFSEKLLPPYPAPLHNYSSLASGVTYILSKSYGQLVTSPLAGVISHIEEFVGFGTGIFIRNGDTTVILASKGFSNIPIQIGQKVLPHTPIAKGRYGYTLYLFRIKAGSIQPPF